MSQLSFFLVLSITVLSWFPATGFLQIGGYLLPYVILILFILFGGYFHSKALMTFLIIATIIFISSLINTPDLYPSNFIFALITYGPWVLLTLNIKASPLLVSRFSWLISWLCILQCVIGVFQLLQRTGGTFVFDQMSSGDSVVGTLLDNAHLYSVKMMLSGLFLITIYLRGDKRGIVLSGAIACLIGVVLSSALFATALFFSACTIFFLFGTKKFFNGYLWSSVVKIKITVVSILVVIVGLFGVVQRDNLALVYGYSNVAKDVIAGERAYGLNKLVVAVDSVKLLTSSLPTSLVGIGFGHYSSRAALIASGGYLRNHPSFIPIKQSSATESYIYPRWNPATWSVQFQDGVMNQPFFSFQSISVELGFPALIFFIGLFVALYFTAIRAISYAPNLLVNYFILPFCFAFPLLLLSDNWLEFPSVTLQVVGFILLARAERQV